MGLALVKAAGYGLPEFERLPATQQERFAVVGGTTPSFDYTVGILEAP